MPLAIFSPGPSYYNPDVRKYAGWTRIFDYMEEAIVSLGYDVWKPNVDLSLVDNTSTVSKITSWDLLAADQLPNDAELFVAPPGYSLAQILRLRYLTPPHPTHIASKECKIITFVFNNADWWRDKMLANEYKAYGYAGVYDLSPTWRWINKRALELSDGVIACSPFVKDTHSKIVPVDKIKIAFWGVDSERFTPDWTRLEKNESPMRVLFVGGDPIRKGLVYLVMAVEQLVKEDSSVKVKIVQAGTNVYMKGANVDIEVVGPIPNEDMPNLMRNCDVIVIPTLEDGIACSIQEGMACGLVPITSPDAAEVFVDGVSGIRCGFRDVDAIKRALAYLYHHPGKRLEMAHNARNLAESQTWEVFKQDFATRVQEITNV